MDDYLAKPVKKPNLEKMLVKWTIEGRKKRAELAKNPGNAKSQKRPAGSRHSSSFLSELSSDLLSPHEHLSSELDRLEFAHRAAIERSSESAGDIALRQQQAEEKAISLRNGLLIESGEDPKTKLGRGVSDDGHHHDFEKSNSTALTAENMQKLGQTRKQDGGGQDGGNSSVAVTTGDTTDLLSRASMTPSPVPSRKPE